MEDSAALPQPTGRLIVVGDIHGCLQELKALMRIVRPQPEDTLISVGDLVNRGPDSAGVIDWAIENNMQTVLGNHEMRLLRSLDFPGKTVLKAYDQDTLKVLKKRHWRYLKSLPLTISLPEWNVVIVHGGFLPNIPWREQGSQIITRIQVIAPDGQPAKRSEAPEGRPWADLWNGPELVFYGHTPRPLPVIRAKSIGLDTGCAYGGQLTACILPGRDLIQVESLQSSNFSI